MLKKCYKVSFCD